MSDDSRARDVSALTTESPHPSTSGDGTIGPYRLLQCVGVGGMGEVWLAEQMAPVRRTVALKVIKAGMDTANVVARFETERQALAVMDHPAIAKVFDAGSTASGRPYFVMEYVRGQPINAYCDSHHLSTRERLDLFLQVCDGVQHAHQKGVIHRDLKPSNILVALRDGHPTPKIIDFGLAKAIGQPLTDRPLCTEIGSLIGTPEYMSPEQAEMSTLDIDTRTDVYALGVMLYELLTGVLPFDSRSLRDKTPDEIRRTVREIDPMRPSARVSLVAGAKHPKADAVRLIRELRGDLDWITMRALEKDRRRRYGSATELAADVRRHLDHLPVLAGPPTTAYRMRKFVRRHRIGVAMIATFIALLALFSATTAVQAVRLARERDRASREAQIAKAVDEFLQHDLLAQASASEQARVDTAPDPDLKVRTALDRAANRIQGKFASEPLVEASIRRTIGNTYRDLGLYPEAQRQLQLVVDIRRRLLGDRHPETLIAMHNLADVYWYQGKYADAEPLFARVLVGQRSVSGPEHAETLSAMNDLATAYSSQGKYARAEPLYVDALRIARRVLGKEHPETLSAMNNLAVLYVKEGRYVQAEQLQLEALQAKRRLLGADHPDTLTLMNNLALVYRRQGKYAEAEPLYVDCLQRRRRALGADHPDTLASMSNLAIVYRILGRYAEAEALFADSLNVKRRKLGEEHRDTLATMLGLALLYRVEGKIVEAERAYAQVVPLLRRTLGDEHIDALAAQSGQAGLYDEEGRHQQAEAAFTRVIETQRRVLGDKHVDTIASMNGLAAVYHNLRRESDADALYAKVIEYRRRALGARHPDTLAALTARGRVLIEQRKYVDAEGALREALLGFEGTNIDNRDRASCESRLGASLAGQQKYEEAEPLLLSGYQDLVRLNASASPTGRIAIDEAGHWILQLYRDWRKPAKAADWRRRLQSSR